MNGNMLVIILFAFGVLIKFRKELASYFGVQQSVGYQTIDAIKGFVSSWWVIPVGIVIVIGLGWAFYANPQPAKVGAWGWNNLVPFLAVVGILTVLVTVNAKNLGTAAKPLQWVLGVMIVLVLVVFPIIGKVTAEEPIHTVIAPNGAKLTVLTMPPNGDSEHFRAPIGFGVHVVGNGYSHHCIYSDGTEDISRDMKHLCHSGPIIYQYLHDETGEPNTATYEFVKG